MDRRSEFNRLRHNLLYRQVIRSFPRKDLLRCVVFGYIYGWDDHPR
jgi:hypothetical protein